MKNREEEVRAKFEWFDNILDARQRGFKIILLLVPDYTAAKCVLSKYESMEDVTVHRARRTVLFGGMEIKVLQEENIAAALGYDRHTTAVVKWRRYA